MSTAAHKLTVSNLKKVFKTDTNDVVALEGVNLNVKDGEFVSIIGTSGCGKTTLLRVIAGLESDFDGEINLNNKKITAPGTDRAVIFQDHRLFPWYSIEDNISFGSKDKDTAQKRERIQHYVDLVGLKGFEKVYPGQVSGGMAQRAAIARALLGKPDVLLLDEPLGALDALTRMYMQNELERIWKEENSTMIMVTHDIEEAIYLSDRVIIMSNRPGTIKRVVEVPLARPRDRASYDFAAIKEEVLKEFHLESQSAFYYSI
jgi:ABC-type nitrate/sulfonate/bicarbonate transport system ATPase subunit